MAKHTTLAKIQAELQDIGLFDTHEHIQPYDRNKGYGLLELFANSYVWCDFLSAGMRSVDMSKMSEEEAWPDFQAFLPKVAATRYFRALLDAIRELHGFDEPEINDSNWRAISEKIRAASRRPDWVRTVLKDRARIEVALLDQFWNVGNTEIDHDLFTLVLRLDPFLIPKHPDHDQNDVAKMAANRGKKVERFDDFLGFMDCVTEENLAGGAVCFKIAAAYERPIRFKPVGEAEARRIYEKPADEISQDEKHAFGDYVVHRAISVAEKHDLPVQIHTGIQAGTGNVLENSNPLHLTSLFMKYPRVRFDLFHGGYPFSSEAGVLAKNFANVYLDLCWLPLISYTAARANLADWLELVPANKILWGGDAFRVEEAYGASRLARRVVTEALAEKVEARYLSEAEALRIGRMILRENGFELFMKRGPAAK